MKKSTIIKLIIPLFGLIFIAVLSYNFVLANDQKYLTGGDAADYLKIGASLAKFQKYGHVITSNGMGVIENFQSENFDENNIVFLGHNTWRPPIWPFLIAGVFMVFGYNLSYIILLKFLLHILGVFLFYKTLKLLNIRIILIILGTFLYGINPAWQLYSRVFLSEPITLFFLTLWLFYFVRYLKGKNYFIIQALIAGIIVLSHPYYLFLPFSVWLILLIKNQIRLEVFLISSLICSSVVSLWIIRNMVVLETNEIILTTSSGAVMAKGWNMDVIDLHTNTKGDLADETLVLKEFDYNREKPLNEVAKQKLYTAATKNFIFSNPDLILPILGVKLRSAFNPFPETRKPGLLETGRWIIQVISLISLIYLVIFSKNEIMRGMAIGLILATIAITTITFSGFRFRMPQTVIEIFFIIFVAHEITQKWKNTCSSNLNLKAKSFLISKKIH